ncbi:MAG: acetyltransferase [bacterium]
MNRYDVFNGDADGICALHQLRLAEPAEAELVTGVKRDIRLLGRLAHVSDGEITVLDISVDSNREALQGLLERGCRVRYFDHHYAGSLPQHERLETHIEVSPQVCTSLLVDRHLGGKYRAWAVTAAFGDNLVEVAEQAAGPLNLTAQELAGLRTVGELLNYNGYGESLDDLFIPPAELYLALHAYAEPLEFLASAPEAETLQRGLLADSIHAARHEPLLEVDTGRVYRFPNQGWARRMMGVFANQAANEFPALATGVIVDNADGTLRVSVRAPLASPTGADQLCRAFSTGGGRPNAAGIDDLPPSELPRFLKAFEQAFDEDKPAGPP